MRMIGRIDLSMVMVVIMEMMGMIVVMMNVYHGTRDINGQSQGC